MKTYILFLFVLLTTCIAKAQTPKPASPHVVFDENNKVYAVKMGTSTFLKFIDSSGTFLPKHVTSGKEYFGKGHTVRIVNAGQETTYETRAEAQALLDYYNEIQLKKEQSKPKPAKYSD